MSTPYPNKEDWIMIKYARCLGKVEEKLAAIAAGSGRDIWMFMRDYESQSGSEYVDRLFEPDRYFVKDYKYRPDRDFIDALKTGPKGTARNYYNIVLLLRKYKSTSEGQKLENIPIGEIQKMYDKLLRVREAILPFMPQEQIMRERYADGGRIDNGISQNNYLRDLYTAIDTASNTPSKVGISFALINGSNAPIPGFVFGRMGENARPEWPYSNWVNNIPDIMLEKIDCYIDLFKEIIDFRSQESEPIVEIPVTAAGPRMLPSVRERPQDTEITRVLPSVRAQSEDIQLTSGGMKKRKRKTKRKRHKKRRKTCSKKFKK